jgi:putative transposase
MSRGIGGETLFRQDDDRRAFLGLVSELPERFGAEVHAFVLMDNHYHLLLRCRRTDISETLRWLQTSYSVRFNWAHRRRGHVFQGRFKSALIQDEGRLEEVGRYLHLNPVRIKGLGLAKEDQRRARVMGCPDPGAELVARRVTALREYGWSSWRVYAGLEPAPGWLNLDRLLGGNDGSRDRQRRAALVAYTEAPIRQGRLDNPWEGLVGGVVLGETREAEGLIRKAAKDPEKARRVVVAAGRRVRPVWQEIVSTAESMRGRSWQEMCEGHGDWGRDGVVAVATRHLGWRLVEVAGKMPGVQYGSLAQGVRRFWRLAEERGELKEFVDRMRDKCQMHRSDPSPS